MRVGMGPKRPKRGCDHVLSVWVALPAHSLGAHACGGGRAWIWVAVVPACPIVTVFLNSHDTSWTSSGTWLILV